MKWLPFSLIVLLMSWLATPGLAAVTEQDFSAVFQGTGEAPYVIVDSTLPGDIIEVTDQGVWDGNALWLTQNVGSQNNSVAFNELVSGPYDQLVIGMDMQFTLYDPPNTGGADGFGLAYANSEIWGSDNSWPIPTFTTPYWTRIQILRKSRASRGRWALASISTKTPSGMAVMPRIRSRCTGMTRWWRRGVWTSAITETSICWSRARLSARRSRSRPPEPDPT